MDFPSFPTWHQRIGRRVAVLPTFIGECMAKKLYNFVCGDCSEEFEKLVESTSKVECPNCGSTNTHVKFNTPSVKVHGGYDTKMRV